MGACDPTYVTFTLLAVSGAGHNTWKYIFMHGSKKYYGDKNTMSRGAAQILKSAKRSHAS
jgi:hypothetical protein